MEKKERPAATNLGLCLRRYRIMGERSMRDIGKELGIGASTWMRLEHGYMPDADTMVKLLVWFLKEPKP